jgi:hypothetical protein
MSVSDDAHQGMIRLSHTMISRLHRIEQVVRGVSMIHQCYLSRAMFQLEVHPSILEIEALDSEGE